MSEKLVNATHLLS